MPAMTASPIATFSEELSSCDAFFARARSSHPPSGGLSIKSTAARPCLIRLPTAAGRLWPSRAC
eukprot:8814390-Alexandrium_andersonii.AAC.1